MTVWLLMLGMGVDGDRVVSLHRTRTGAKRAAARMARDENAGDPWAYWTWEPKDGEWRRGIGDSLYVVKGELEP